jgi:hypothetical protein
VPHSSPCLASQANGRPREACVCRTSGLCRRTGRWRSSDAADPSSTDRPSSELLDVPGGDRFGRIGVPLDIPLRPVSETALQLVGVGSRHARQLEGKGVAQIVGTEWRDAPRGIAALGVVPAADLLENVVDRPDREAADGIYYLRLRVRDGVTTRVSSPQVVQTDNTGPFPLPRPTIKLQLQKPDGTRVDLKCGKVKKGDGLIVVTVHAYDPNFSQVAVTARGNSGLSVPLISTSAVPLSKTYNGNLADQGYPAPIEFLWDPWSDPRIVPCCYVVYVEIWDRAVLNDSWSGGHYNAGWEAIEIGV